MSSITDLEALLTINACRAIPFSTYQPLLRHFGSPSAIVKARRAELGATGLVTAAVAARLAEAAAAFDPTDEMERARADGVSIVPHDADGYPGNLLNTFDPPLLLYVKGEILKDDRLALALVGSRRCSHYGKTQAEQLGLQLASAGFCIVSGLAYGIDAAAHRAALRAGGRTIAVQGCGLARTYPPRHGELAAEIARHGALLSELPLDAAPAARNFPARNRIISGLSLGVIVVEAAKRSGSLITARWAAEQGREVFALPGPLNSPVSRGSNALIQDGAKLVQSPQDILTELGPLADSVELSDGRRIEDARGMNLQGSEAALFALLRPDPLSIEQLIEASGLSAGAVNSALLTLEIKGLARRWEGMRFTRS